MREDRKDFEMNKREPLGRGPPAYDEKTGHEENPGPAKVAKDIALIDGVSAPRKRKITSVIEFAEPLPANMAWWR